MKQTAKTAGALISTVALASGAFAVAVPFLTARAVRRQAAQG